MVQLCSLFMDVSLMLRLKIELRKFLLNLESRSCVGKHFMNSHYKVK